MGWIRSTIETAPPVIPDRGAEASRKRHYVGDDRRAAPATARPAELGILALTFASIVAAWILIEIALLFDRPMLESIKAAVLVDLLHTVIAVLGAVVAFLAFVRWRAAGVADPVWTGTGALFLGTIAVGLGQLVPLLAPAADRTSFVAGVQPAAQLVAVALLFACAVTPVVDTRVTPRRVVLAGIGLTAALAWGIYALPVSGDFLGSHEGRLVFAVGWLAVTVVHLGSASKRRSRTHFAIATATATLALAEATRFVASGSDTETAAFAAFFQAMALAVLLSQGLRDFERTFCDQRSRLFDSEVEVEQVQALRRAEHAAHEERVHDAKSALFAIEGAAQMLDRHRDQLDPERRAQLSEAVTAEIARLQKLIAQNRHQEDCEPFSLAELIMPIVTTEQARGSRVGLDVPGDLVAVGRSAATAEVIRNLLDNARHYAPGSPVDVRAEVDGGWAVLYVEDRGRGVHRGEREAIFERGRRGAAADGVEGSGLGLFVSRRLMVEQGGDLWAENRPGGGARFALCLPRDPDEAAISGEIDALTKPSGRSHVEELR